MTLGVSSLCLPSQFSDCWKLHCGQVRKQHAQAHCHWFCPVPVGGDLYPSLMERFRPIWKQRGCTVTHTHTAELMDHPVLRSLQTGWRYRTLTDCTQGAACLLSSILPLLFHLSLSLLLCCHDYTVATSCSWFFFSLCRHVHTLLCF